MNADIGFFCKSYHPDFKHLDYMLSSFARHNPENLLLTLSLPAQDIAAFEARFGTGLNNLRVVSDESYCGHDLKLFRGWQGQQICKLMSWQVVQAAHYVVLDSDCYFIRDVRAADVRPSGAKPFVACGSAIRTVLKPDNRDLLRYMRGELEPGPGLFPQAPAEIFDLMPEFIHFKDLDQDNPGAIERSAIPYKVFGNTRWLFYQPGQFFSRALLQRMCGYFAAHGLSAGDAILICPWEYNWYGEYAATHGFAETEFKISPFLHFQAQADIVFARAAGITEALMRERFAIVQMAAGHLDDLVFR